MHKLLTLLLISIHFLAVSQSDSKIVKIAKVEVDHRLEGALGILVECTSDFKFMFDKYNTDSLFKKAMDKANFNIYSSVLQKNARIQPAYGHGFIKRKDGNLEVKTSISTPLSYSADGLTSTRIFIPYACMKLPSETQEIQVKLTVRGKDSYGVTFTQSVTSEVIKFTKPPIKTFTFNLDSMYVKAMNDKGQAWDYTFSNGDAPDILLTLKMGDMTIGKLYKENAFEFNYTEKPKVFSFYISEGDEVILSLVDFDSGISDAIASWRFISANMKPNIVYEQKEAKSNLTGFHFNFKVRE